MVGKRVSRCVILEKLDEGGIGVVHRDGDTRLKRNVALQFLLPELTRDGQRFTRMMSEVKSILAQVRARVEQ